MRRKLTDCIIVFTKNPVPNQVKTRLIPFLSPDCAASLYRAFLVDWCSALRKISTAHLVIAYTPPDSLIPLQKLIGGNAIFIPQVGLNLGERLISGARWAHNQGYSKYLLVGSDSPTLPLPYVERAFNLLESRDAAIGQSVDGGYYLIGFSSHGASLAIPEVFQGITWSTDIVFRQTLEKIKSANARLGLLPPWYDVDTPEAFQRLCDHIFAMRLAGEEISAPKTAVELSKILESSAR